MILLCDTNVEMVAAWRVYFGLRVPIVHKSVFNVPASVLVAPGNSVGLMSGGLDLAIARQFPGVEVRVQQAIEELGRDLPIGDSVLASTGEPSGGAKFAFIRYVPTMRIAQDVSETKNAYLAMQAILRHNNDVLIVVPGLCTGVGKMPVMQAAEQMYRAYTGDFT